MGSRCVTIQRDRSIVAPHECATVAERILMQTFKTIGKRVTRKLPTTRSIIGSPSRQAPRQEEVAFHPFGAGVACLTCPAQWYRGK